MLNFSKSLIAASSKPLILGILQGGKSYGYEIIQKVKQISQGTLEWSDGMLYPVLHKLEKDGLVESEWQLSDNGRHRKYYSITVSGKAELHTEKNNWMSMHEVMLRFWSTDTSIS